MRKKHVIKILSLGIITLLFTGCAPKVPMAPTLQDKQAKQFSKPDKDKSGIYIYRNSFLGSALEKTLYIDDKVLGSIVNKTYFYKQVPAGQHNLATTSEFSPNTISVQTKGGQNYYFEHYIKMGVVVGGANIKQVSEEEGQKNILECQLAK